MSWEIVYGKQFIRTNKGIIPLMLNGSNNCWQGGKRERNWNVMFSRFYDKYIYTEQEIMNIIDYMCKNADYEEWFKTSYSGSFLNNEELKKFYKNAIKKALTVEEIMKYSYATLMVSFCDLSEHSPVVSMQEYIKTTEQLENWIKNALEKRVDKSSQFLNIRFGGDEAPKIKKDQLSRDFKDTDKVFIKSKSRYIIEASEKSIETIKDKEEARIFTYKEAKELFSLPEMKHWGLKIVKYSPIKEKNYILQFRNEEKRIGGYVVRKLKYGFNYSHRLDDKLNKKFSSEKEANEYIQKNFEYQLQNNYVFKAVNVGA